jgi:hypothetical protein
MMSEDELLHYFMEQTNKSLEQIQKDVKSLLGFRMALLGGAAVISALVSYVVVIFFGR